VPSKAAGSHPNDDSYCWKCDSFAVLSQPGFEEPNLGDTLIAKPKNEAVSMSIQIVENERELRKAAQDIFDRFYQPALVELSRISFLMCHFQSSQFSAVPSRSFLFAFCFPGSDPND
jgi:hypothetical protein